MTARTAFPILFLLVLFGLPVGPACAEQDRVIVPMDDELVRTLREGERHLDAERWNEGILFLAKVLDRSSPTIVPVRNRASDGVGEGPAPSGPLRQRGEVEPPVGYRYQGIGEAVRDRLLGMPEPGRQAFRRLFRRAADERMAEALRGRDSGLLAEVARRYPLLPHGGQAERLLGDLAWERGDFVRAARHYGAGLALAGASAAPGTPDAEVRTLALGLAACETVLGRPWAARRAAARTGEGGFGGLRIAGGRVAGTEALDAVGAAVRAEGQGTVWPCFAGSRDRIRVLPEGPFAVGLPLWNRDFVNRDAKTPPGTTRWGGGLNLFHGERRSGGASRPAYRVFPVQVNGVLYLTGNNLVSALDPVSGRLLAEFERPVDRSWDDENVDHNYAVTVAGGRLYTSQIGAVVPGEYWRGIPIKEDIAVRTLVCHDLRTGEKVWSLAESGDPFLTRASFPEAPVVAGDTVYATATLLEGFVKSYLVAVDAASGRLRFRTWIASGQVETTMFGYHAREALASMPSMGGDTVFHVSNVGVVSAVDAVDGTIRWMTRYEQTPIEPTSGYFPVERPIGWANAPPVVWEDLVYAAPLDSRYLYAFDAVTGEVRWAHRRNDHGAILRHIVGIVAGRIVLSGAKAVILDARTGDVKGVTLLESGGTGRGVIAGTRALIPAEDRIYVIDIETGKLIEEVPLPTGMAGISGNLLPLDGRVLIAGPHRLHVFRNEPLPPPQVPGAPAGLPRPPTRPQGGR